jgi:hypothetical protein
MVSVRAGAEGANFPSACFYASAKSMAKSINASAKRRGRPVTTGTGTTIGVRMLDDPLAALDAWIAKQKEPELTRPEAIRRLVELGLRVKGK